MPTASENVCSSGNTGSDQRAVRTTRLNPGCVKTCASRERAELFSPFSCFDHDGQCCSFLIQRNRDKLSTREFDVGVFTQPGPRADVGCLGASSVWTAVRAIANCDWSRYAALTV